MCARARVCVRAQYPAVHFCICSISTCIIHACATQSLVMFGYLLERRVLMLNDERHTVRVPLCRARKRKSSFSEGLSCFCERYAAESSGVRNGAKLSGSGW